ncbi:MAG: hypothetical protein ACRCY8_06895 [Dermatophilaceae bacterium]
MAPDPARPAAGVVTAGRLRVVVAGVRSTTHLVYAASWLRHAADDGARQEIVVDDLGSRPFLGRDRVDPSDAVRLLSLDGRLDVRPAGSSVGSSAWWAAEGGEERVLLSVGAPATKAWARMRAAAPGRRPGVVVVDEGLGSYGDWRTRRAAWGRQGVREPWRTVRALALAGAGRVLTDVRWALYAADRRGWRVVPEVAGEFRAWLTGAPASTGTAVLLTQPWVELGLLPADEYAAHVDAVARACATHGLHLRVRAHPAEDVGRYTGFDLADGAGPAELDRAVTTAAVVLGSDSTALLNTAAVHGTPAVRVSVPGLEHLAAGLGARQRRLLDAYLPAPRHPDDLGPGLDAAGEVTPR